MLDRRTTRLRDPHTKRHTQNRFRYGLAEAVEQEVRCGRLPSVPRRASHRVQTTVRAHDSELRHLTRSGGVGRRRPRQSRARYGLAHHRSERDAMTQTLCKVCQSSRPNHRRWVIRVRKDGYREPACQLFVLPVAILPPVRSNRAGSGGVR